MSGFRLLLRPLLNAQQLVRPQPLKCFRPLIQRTDSLRVRLIKHLPPVPPNPHQSHLAQHLQVFRNRRLLHAEPHHQLSHGPLATRQMLQNVPPPRLGHGIKGIRSSRCSGHGQNIYSYMGICQARHHCHTLEFSTEAQRCSTHRAAHFIRMSYQTAIARMYALGHELAQTPSHKFDLKHMRVLLSALEHPERQVPGVLIAGTNGKGSTAATLASIFQASGLRTGLYTSPHLVRINERIRIDGAAIADDEFALLHDMVDRTAERLVAEGELPWHPSFFEMLTAMAFEHFARKKVDIAVLEVGMGGRLDATNVIEPRVSVITDISLDHQKFLGNTVAEIAREKAGILRRNGIAVLLPQQREVN